MSKGPRQYTVVKVVRMTAGDAEKLSRYARLSKMSESEAVRGLIRGLSIRKDAKFQETQLRKLDA